MKGVPDVPGWIKSLQGKAHFYDQNCWWSICYRGADGERPRMELRPMGSCAHCMNKLKRRAQKAQAFPSKRGKR